MKKLLIALLSLTLGISLNAQTYCENFDNCFVDPNNLTATRNHAFNTYGNGNSGCLQDWEVTNGTPAVYRNVDGFGAAYQGSQYMFLGVDNTVIGEGAALQYNFQAGKSYQITFARKNASAGTQLNIDYVLLQSAIPYTYNTGVGASAVPAIPGNAYVAHSDNNYNNNTWQVITITTPVLTTGYSRLWFRPSWTTPGQGQAFLLVDSLCIQEVPAGGAFTGCTSFEDCVIDTTNATTLSNTRNHTFNTFGNGNPGCLEDWEVTNGTPSIYRTADGFGPAYAGDQYVFLGVDNNTISEGAALKYNFQAGKSYEITFARKNAVPGTQLNIDYVLLQSQIPYTYSTSVGASAPPAIPGNALVAAVDAAFTSNNWQILKITTPVLANSYSRIWFRPTWTTSTQAQTFFLMDSLCINEVTPPVVSSPCTGFEDCLIDATNSTTLTATRNHTFNTYGNGNPGCLEDWEVTNGTPSIYRDVDGFGPAYTGNQFVFLGVDNTVISEGIAYKYNFQAGQSYRITFARKNAVAGTQLKMDYVLLQNQIPYTYSTSIGASATPAIPGNALVVQTESSLTSNNWQLLTITTPVLTGNFTRFWIRPSWTASTQAQTFFLMDSFCIEPFSCDTNTLALSINASDLTCTDPIDTATLNLTGGTAPYTYSWNTGETASSIVIQNPGIYTVVVTDSNGCVRNAVDTVLNLNMAVSLQNSILASCNGASNGSVDVQVTNGTPPYTYAWSNGATTDSITGLALGTYTLTVTDNVSCSATFSHQVTQAPSGMSVTVQSSNPASCSGASTGMVDVQVTSGVTPYTYAWNNGATTDSIAGLPVGTYTLTVTDNAGCSITFSHQVNQAPSTISITQQSFSPVACNGVSNGKIDVQVAGGLPPYSYAWSNGATTDSVVGLAVGLYTLTVTDNAGCSATYSKQINQTTTNYSYYVYTSTVKANCVNNGSAKATPSGGVGPYTYLWNTVPAQTTQTATGLAPGVYTVTVTGSNGCTRTGTATVGTSCKNVINGFAYFDTNGNCQKDTGEAILSSINVTATNGTNTYYGNTNSAGFFSINCANPGTYTVNAIQSSGYSNCPSSNVCGAQSAVFQSLGDTTSLNFGFAASSGFNLRIQPTWNIANPGFAKTYSIRYYQQSQPLYNGAATIVFEYDTILLYQSSTQGGVHDPVAHTVTWNVPSVPYPTWNNNLTPFAYFVVPVTTPIGYMLRQEFWINPVQGDCDTLDNHFVSVQPVTGSFDPNEKNVTPAGDIIEEDSVLTYTIHFQNTGNDTTWFIVLKDTLSQHLQPQTAFNLASSHPYSSFDIADNGILTWEFNPIYLVDSLTNEAASKGFVTFKVKKKPNLPLNTVIENSAGIYFDYNEPIITNTVSSKLTAPDFVFSLSNDPQIAVTAMPNPFSSSTVISVEGVNGAFSFELVDVSGKVMKQLSVDGLSSFEIQRHGMAKGVYFYSVTTKNKQRAYGKLIVQ